MIRETAYKDFLQGEIGNKEILASVQTTDATITTLQSVTVPDNTAGFMKVTVFAADISVANKLLIGTKIIQWSATGGTVTMWGAINDVVNNLVGLTTATWTVDASGLTLRIRVTGEAATNIEWYALYDNNYIELTPP